MLLMTVRSATKDEIEKITQAEHIADNTTHALTTGPSSFHFVHSSQSHNSVDRSTEVRLLAFVTNAIDSALELNGTVQNPAEAL